MDAHDLDEVKAAVRPNTKAIYLETLGNPNSDIPDIDAIAAIAHAHQIPLVIDNTFGTPYLIRPIEHGADIVLHSATKFIGGHGTTLGGIVVDSGKFDWKAAGKFAPIAEANPSYHGISFVDAADPSLPDHPDHALFEKYFPYGGASIFTFDIKGGVKEAHAFIDALEIFSLLANVADVKSLVIHPATTTHSQLSAEELEAADIHPNTIRLSIGTEHIEDILADLEKGFAAAAALA